jgi:hypothetical protein
MLKLGEEQIIETADGRSWRLGRLELRVVRAFRDWISHRVGDPFAIVERFLGKIGDAALMPYFKEAQDVRDDLTGFSLATKTAGRFLATEEGMAKLVALLLEPAHGKVSEEDAFLVAQAVATKLEAVLSTASGSVPNAQAPAA